MILSMTGFGEAQLEEGERAYHLDVRSVNNRYFKSSIRLPDDFAFMESELEQFLRRRLTRGSVTMRVYVRDLSAAAAQNVNLAAVRHYLSQLESIAAPGTNLAVDLATLAMLPGVCQPHELSDAEREHAATVILRLGEAAVANLIDMRAVEGRALAADLARHCAVIREHLQAVRSRAPGMVAGYRDRLTRRVEELLAGSNVRLAAEDLLKEVSVYAERSDVSEELSRLTSHLEQFDEAMAAAEPSGRKLEFIAQEMLREANTIGAKASDADIARYVIEIKGAVDRIKEQVQNVA